MLKQITSFSVEPQHEPERAGDIRYSYADIRKAERILGYKPQVNLKDGSKEVVDWFLQSRESTRRLHPSSIEFHTPLFHRSI